MNDLHELNSLWKELPTMQRLNIVPSKYAAADDLNCFDAWEHVKEHFREEGRQQERERQEMEHCREHMGDGHGGTGNSESSNSVFCLLGVKIREALYNKNKKINEEEVINDIKSLIRLRNDFNI